MIEILLAGTGGIKVEYSEYSRIISGSGTLQVPAGAKAMRVAVIGGGGAGKANSQTINRGGGGGGGCAATKIIKAEPVSYTIGLAGTQDPRTNGEDTVANFSSYSLIGGGGITSDPTGVENGGDGGLGSGGDYNFSGGNGSARSGDNNIHGGGAAGPKGNGNGGLSSSGWGVGGGGGQTSQFRSSTAGGGSGAPAITEAITIEDAGTMWGKSSQGSGGGEMGGGGMVERNFIGGGDGGSGGMVVEWFF